ncbi:hypothetical protein FD755_001663, partial [Muntiacus reevesi]
MSERLSLYSNTFTVPHHKKMWQICIINEIINQGFENYKAELDLCSCHPEASRIHKEIRNNILNKYRKFLFWKRNQVGGKASIFAETENHSSAGRILLIACIEFSSWKFLGSHEICIHVNPSLPIHPTPPFPLWCPCVCSLYLKFLVSVLCRNKQEHVHQHQTLGQIRFGHIKTNMLGLLITLAPFSWNCREYKLCNKIVFLVSFVGNRGTFTRGYRAVILDMAFLYHVAYVLVCMLGLFVHEFFYSFLLFDLVYREETLLNVIKSVTRNGRSIILTAVLALILVYLFSIIGFLFLKDDFTMEVDRLKNRTPVTERSPWHAAAENILSDCCRHEYEDGIERTCDTLLMCIVTVLNQGLRNGGGVGDVLRRPSKDEPLFAARVVYDLLFYFIVIIIVLNLIFGVIIDTFADLRSEKQKKEEILKTTCFICGLERDKFDNKTVSFEEHIKSEHNMWHYLYFLVLVKVKDPTEYTGPESYVAQMIVSLLKLMSFELVNIVASDAEAE